MYKLLTNREYDIITRMHKTNQEIAHELNISTSTVVTIIQRLFTKFKVKNRAEMVIKALKTGLIDISVYD